MTTTQFGKFGLDERLLEALEKNGLLTPTPIQDKAISVLVEGHDVLGVAQTGTGKTAAFVLPVLQQILQLKGAPAPKTARALILTPTRELANQIADAVKKLTAFTNINCVTVVGGQKPLPQIKALAKGVDVLVATPGRLEDHMREKAISLDSTMMIVLDEADQMLDMGFIPAIRRIMTRMPRKKQSALFSATMPPMIKDLAAKFMSRPREISVAPANKPIESIEQRVFGVAQSRKQSALIEQLSEPDVDLAIVFVRTKRGADRVQRVLDKAGIASQAIHGDRSQAQRDRALKAFRDGRTRILIATDVAARGIDVPAVTHVINFDLPQQAENYVHRIGRTARAGASGIAISFMNPMERDMLKEIEKITKQKFKVTPLKIADQTAELNDAVQTEQASEEETAKTKRMARENRDNREKREPRSRNKPKGKGDEGKPRAEGGDDKRDNKREEGRSENRRSEEKRDDKREPRRRNKPDRAAKSRDEHFDDKRDKKRQQAHAEDDFKKKSDQQGQRARKRERQRGSDEPRPHRAIQRDADREWEAGFESALRNADGMDTPPKPKPGKARAKPKPAGKANRPNSKKGAVARATEQKRRTRHKASKKPEAKPRGFIKK